MSSTMIHSCSLAAKAPVAQRPIGGKRSSAALAVSRSRKSVTTMAAQGPSSTAAKVFGALAAAQMALLPFAGAAHADAFSNLLPETAKSEQARDDLNRKTSDLPSIKDVGASLQENLGFSDASEIGQKINENTPDVGDIKGAAKKGLRDIGRATPDLPGARDVGRDVKSAGRDLGAKIDRNTPNLPSAGQIGEKIKQNTPDLPSPQGILDRLQGK